MHIKCLIFFRKKSCNRGGGSTLQVPLTVDTLDLPATKNRIFGQSKETFKIVLYSKPLISSRFKKEIENIRSDDSSAESEPNNHIISAKR